MSTNPDASNDATTRPDGRGEREAARSHSRAERDAARGEGRAEHEARRSETRAEREATRSETRAEREASRSEARAEREADRSDRRTEREIARSERRADREIRTSDPDRIRALAHPLRLALIDVIQDLGEATASQCAERLDQTVANCSFHLRVLEKAGFIERAEPRGREKPWRSASSRRILEPDMASTASVLALAELITANMAHISSRFTGYLRDHSATDDPAWRDATSLDQATLWATVDEAKDVRAALAALQDTFRERRDDPSKRPEGARLVRLSTLIHPEAPDSSE